MAHLYRLIFAAFALFFTVPSFALVPQVTDTKYQFTSPYSSGGYIYSSPTDACNGLAARATSSSQTGTVTGLVSTTNPLNFACTIQTVRKSDGYTSSFTTTIYGQSTLICPSNSTLSSGTSCACNAGFDEVNGQCLPSCPYGRDPITNQCNACPTGEKQFTTIVDTGSTQACAKEPACGTKSGKVVGTVEKEGANQPSTSYACSGGCVAKVSYGFGLKYTDSQGADHQSWVGDAIGTGAACATNQADGSAPDKPAPVDNPNNPNSPKTAQCPVGQVKQTINGISACGVPSSGDTTKTSNTTTSTDAAGNTTTKVDTTTCVGTQCTTTTTSTTTPAGGGTPTTTTTSKDQNKATFCQENPGLSICKEGSFNGSCGAEPACTGDAIACAAASAAFKSACALNPNASSESALYDSSKTQTGSVTSTLPGNESKSVSSSSFDQTERFSSAGLVDLNVSVSGHSVSIPMSNLNTWLGYIGAIGVAVSLLIAMRIALGGV